MTNFNIMRLIWNCYLIAILSVGPSIQYPKADCLIDVVFLFDESSAVPDAMFNKTLRTVDATLNILDVKEMGVNVGVSCYADTVRQIFQMDYFYSKTTIKSKINGMKRQTNVGLVNIQNALNRTCRVMFSSRAGGRAKAVNYLVVISPMTSVKDAELDAVVAYCKSRSVRIISITEGSSSVISNTIAYDSTYQFELKDENTVAKSLSTLIRDNAGCKEAALACDVSSTTMGEDNYSPKFSDGLPESVEISGHLGKHIKLRCKIDSNPGSFVIWYKEEDEIKSSKRIRIYKNYLLIKNFRAEDAKEYFCKGTNPFGSIVRRFFVSLSENEQEQDTTEELGLMKNQLSTLTRKFEDLSNNNVHIHINKDNDDQSTTMKGQHIFLNLMLNEKQSHQDKAIIDEEIHANCEMVTNSNFEEFGQIKGNVYLVQKEGGPVHVDVHLSGFEMREGKSHKHGFSLHEYGDMSRSCDSLGLVYNQKKPRHRSSRNSIMCDDEGGVHLKYMDKSLSLHGKHSVIGRSFVVNDDSEGRRIACCVIGRAEIHDHDEMDMEKIHFSEEFIEHHDTPTGEPIPFRPDPMFPGRYTTDKPIPFRPDPIFPGRQTTDRPIPYRPNPRFPDRDITEEPIPFRPDPRYPNRDIAHFIDE